MQYHVSNERWEWNKCCKQIQNPPIITPLKQADEKAYISTVQHRAGRDLTLSHCVHLLSTQ